MTISSTWSTRRSSRQVIRLPSISRYDATRYQGTIRLAQIWLYFYCFHLFTYCPVSFSFSHLQFRFCSSDFPPSFFIFHSLLLLFISSSYVCITTYYLLLIFHDCISCTRLHFWAFPLESEVEDRKAEMCLDYDSGQGWFFQRCTICYRFVKQMEIDGLFCVLALLAGNTNSKQNYQNKRRNIHPAQFRKDRLCLFLCLTENFF